MREMIPASNIADRRNALRRFKRAVSLDDFAGIFRALKGLPATIRFLDPPLHEFLPNEAAAQQELAQKLGVPAEKIAQRVNELHEFNPMLGHRGCRLGIVYPEISEMQARAVFEAAALVQKEGIKVKPEIMILPSGFPRANCNCKIEVVNRIAAEVAKEKEDPLPIPGRHDDRCEFRARAFSSPMNRKDAEFFSFGSNDLTTDLRPGMSGDDSGSFLPRYQELEIVKQNRHSPTIDQSGVGCADEDGRRTRASDPPRTLN